MKKCPNCNRVYDDSQSFCLEDGAALAVYAAADSQEKFDLPRRKSKLPLILGGLLLLLVGTLTAGWLLLNSRAKDTSQTNRQIAVNIQTPVSTPTPLPTATETPTPLPSPSPSPSVSPEANANASTNSETNSEAPLNSKPPDESSPANPLPVVMKTEDHQVLFALHECRKSGSSITCLFSLTNKGQDREFQLSVYKSKLYDELGNGYKGSDAQLANKSGDFPKIGFISGVTTRAQMTFEKVEPETTKITLLTVGFEVGSDYNLSANFRNVPLLVSK
jgi:hypothetical protein